MHLFFNNTLIYDESVERNILALMNKKKRVREKIRKETIMRKYKVRPN